MFLENIVHVNMWTCWKNYHLQISRFLLDFQILLILHKLVMKWKCIQYSKIKENLLENVSCLWEVWQMEFLRNCKMVLLSRQKYSEFLLIYLASLAQSWWITIYSIYIYIRIDNLFKWIFLIYYVQRNHNDTTVVNKMQYYEKLKVVLQSDSAIHFPLHWYFRACILRHTGSHVDRAIVIKNKNSVWSCFFLSSEWLHSLKIGICRC